MLEFSDISFSYPSSGRTLLDGLSGKVGCGEFLALLGVNGAGKSTLLNLLGGYEKPQRGQIFIGGVDVSKSKPRELAKKRAFLEQESELNFGYTLLETVLLGRYAWNGGFSASGEDAEIARGCIEKVGLSGLEKRFYTSLSGGEKRRAQLARVLAQIFRVDGNYENALLLLDEPCAGLDPAHAHLAMGLAKEISSAGGSVVAVLHDANLASQYADKIAILKDSRFFAFAPVADVMNDYTLSAAYGAPCKILSDSDGASFAVFEKP